MSGPRPRACAAVLAPAGCDDGVSPGCPAVAWGNAPTVELADEGSPVQVSCPEPCRPGTTEGAPSGPIREGVAPLVGDRATVSFVLETPDEVAVAVLGPDGAVLAELTAVPEWCASAAARSAGGRTRPR